MKTTVKELSDTSVEIKVTLDATDLKDAEKKALEKLAKEVKVEGFRKGKVPVDIAKRFIPENDLNTEAINFAVNTSIIKAFVQNSENPISAPSVNITKYIPGEMAEYVATAEVLPKVKLGDFKNLNVKKIDTKVSDKDIAAVLANIQNSFSTKKAVKRKAKLTDEVIIDFVGKKDGEAFQGGSAKDYHLILGSDAFIPGFESGIVNHEPGDKFNLDLVFPKDYGMKNLAGAKTVFEVLLKQINEVVKPELNDELATKCGPFKNLTELKNDIKKNLETQNNHRATERYKDDLVDALVKKTKISAPEILIKDQLRFIKDDITRNAASQGLSFEDYLERVGETNESWEKEAREIAENRVKASLILQILARDQKITVSDDIVEAKIAELRDVYQKSPEAIKNLKNPNVKTDIKNRLIIEKTLDFLVKSNEKK